MGQIFKLLCLLLLTKFCLSFNAYNALTGVKMIFPKKVLTDIPSKLVDKIKKYDEDHDGLTTSYTFPVEYKTTIFKDHDKKTTLVNVFPTVETKTYSLKYQDLGYQVLETSTTLLFDRLNATVEYQTTPMLNSTLTYPITAPIQTFGYATPEYQHEILVYPTRINITQITSTSAVNYTKVEHVDNTVPFV
ncbi:UNVERIFIED_CONTAM: hypothetical protein RMT77_001997 [Armadillidium vulgare]